MANHAIEFSGVRRTLGARSVLAGVELAVGSGETVALVGANGAGKSTLIRALLDLRAIDAGTIRLEGRAHTERRARSRLAYLPERFQPPYYLTGIGYVNYMLALYGVRPGDAPVADVCGELGLDEVTLARSVRGYSKGMAQLLGLGACLLSGRPLLVLDEPMSGLDPTARQRFQAALVQRREAGGTTLFTTHLMPDAEAVADRVAVLHGGRIVADEPPAELAARYQAPSLEAAFVHCVAEAVPQLH